MQYDSVTRNVKVVEQTVFEAGKAGYLGRSGPELLEEVREEGGIMLQLGQDLHIVEQHHALERSKCLIIQHLNTTHKLKQTAHQVEA